MHIRTSFSSIRVARIVQPLEKSMAGGADKVIGERKVKNGEVLKNEKLEGEIRKKFEKARRRRIRCNMDESVKRIRNNSDTSSSTASSALASSPSSSTQSSTTSRSGPSDSDGDGSNSAMASETREVTDIVTGIGNVCSPCLSYGHVSIVGRRREMEDAVTVMPNICSKNCDFFGVYDGHGGAQVAAVCKERMHAVLADVAGRDWPEGDRWKVVLGECFAKVDAEVGTAAAGAESAEKNVGSTAVVAVVGAEKIVVANCGDSRVVLCRGGVAVPLSSDHKPDRPDEMERVEAAGGKVINWDGYRVLGVLATSRSIGDYYLKPYVISEPEVTITNRTERDEFIILASDGLWDVIPNEVACRIARQCLNGRVARMFPEAISGSSASEAAAFLAELAMSRGSRDNISVVVVELKRLNNRERESMIS